MVRENIKKNKKTTAVKSQQKKNKIIGKIPLHYTTKKDCIVIDRVLSKISLAISFSRSLKLNIKTRGDFNNTQKNKKK